MTHWTPTQWHWSASQWAAIERHARAERICAMGARVTASDPYIASHWHQERSMHAQMVRCYLRAADPLLCAAPELKHIVLGEI